MENFPKRHKGFKLTFKMERLKSESDKIYQDKIENLCDELRFLIIKSILDFNMEYFKLRTSDNPRKDNLTFFREYYEKRNKFVDEIIRNYKT